MKFVDSLSDSWWNSSAIKLDSMAVKSNRRWKRRDRRGSCGPPSSHRVIIYRWSRLGGGRRQPGAFDGTREMARPSPTPPLPPRRRDETMGSFHQIVSVASAESNADWSASSWRPDAELAAFTSQPPGKPSHRRRLQIRTQFNGIHPHLIRRRRRFLTKFLFQIIETKLNRNWIGSQIPCGCLLSPLSHY